MLVREDEKVQLYVHFVELEWEKEKNLTLKLQKLRNIGRKQAHMKFGKQTSKSIFSLLSPNFMSFVILFLQFVILHLKIDLKA